MVAAKEAKARIKINKLLEAGPLGGVMAIARKRT